MEILLAISILISIFLTVIALPKWIKKCRQVGLLWEDMNKVNKIKRVAASGGVIVVMAFVLGVLSYIAIRTFVFNGDGANLQIFALLSIILILALVGFIDDILGWTFKGLSARFRLFLAFAAAIPIGINTNG